MILELTCVLPGLGVIFNQRAPQELLGQLVEAVLQLGTEATLRCGAVAPGTRSLRSTERYSIDRAIHSLVCCSTREAWRRDALLSRVSSAILLMTALSQDNLGREGESAVTREKT